ncbi:hypothetical protein AB0F81_32950 [Actinoplanes sp. NPDC024001]|uniref:hypothetical protein n=1 Tax=Actinoplanes sp. NPDC024001 TaxID=3154598 RepID=UPI0033F5FCEE
MRLKKVSTTTAACALALLVSAQPALAAPVEPAMTVTERVAGALAGADAEAETGGPTVTTDGDIAVSSEEPSVSLTDSDNWARVSLIAAPAEAVAAEGEARVFPDVAKDADSVIRPVEGGAQLLYVMHSAAAPRTQRYRVDLAAGTTVEATGDGGFLLVDRAGEAEGVIEAPWARDASGRELPTRYHWADGVLIQETDTAGAVFPVVADPKITFGVGVYLNMFGSEARTYGMGIVAMGGAAAAVGCATLDKVPHAVKILARIACGAGVVSLPKVFAAVKSIAQDKSLDDRACYQVKIIPFKGGKKKVAAKNCK